MRTSDQVGHDDGGASPPGAATQAATGNPFPGPRPFSEDEADVFFGREREIEHVLALLVVERAVLVHAASGAGKSSLINAGVIPRARERGFDPMPVARVRDPLGARREETANRYVANVLENWRDDPALAGAPDATTLVEFLAALGPAREPGRVMVLDQFEEIFLYPESWRDRADLFRQVQTALDKDPRLRVLFIMRDDYLARLEPFTPLLRDRLRARYRITGLHASQARAATVEPFERAGVRFAPGAADALVRGLLLQPQEDPAAPRYEGEHVEPVQLQIVCRTLFDRLADRSPAVDVVSEDDVRKHADVDQALAGFYDEAVAAAVRSSRHVKERAVRLWFEKRLITPSRARHRILREAEDTGGLPNDVVDLLEQRRVVHAEARGRDRWYELTHDRFVDAVLSSNRAWFASPQGRERRVPVWVELLGLLVLVGLGVMYVMETQESGGGEEFTKYEQIETPNSTVAIEVDGQAGQLLTALLRPDADLKGHMELRHPDGVTVLAGSADSARQGSVLTARLPVAGLFQLVASGRESSVGSFVVTIRLETVGTDDRAIELGTAVDGIIDASDEVDVYVFDGAKDTVVSVRIDGQAGFDSGLVLISPTGAGFFDDDGGGGGDAALALVLPEAGTYSIRASSTGSGTGSYRLGLEVFDDDVLVGNAGRDVGAQHPVQVHVVRSAEGGFGTFRVVPDPRMDAYVVLRQADARLLETRDGDGVGKSETLLYPIVPNVTYLVVVSSNDASASGSYSLSMQLQPPVPLGDRTISGELVAGEGGDAYRLDAEASEVPTISVRGDPQFVVRVQILGTDGGPLTNPQEVDPGEQVDVAVRLPTGGQYIVVVSATSRDHPSMSYSLGVTRKSRLPLF